MKEFANFTKCVLAQSKTTEALVVVVTKSFEMLIKRTIDEHDILIFLECMENQNVFQIKNKRKEEMSSKHRKKNKSTWNCKHSSCANFFKTLVEHYIPPQTDQWDIYPSTKTKQHENRNSTQKTQTCTSPEREAKRDDESTLSDDRLWLIAKLYKFTESQDVDSHCQTLDELDISHMIKIQRCCSLFEFDDSARIYDNIITNRNKLMHSINHLVADEDLKKIFDFFYNLLEAFGKEFDVCVRVLKELKEFEKSLLEIKVLDMVRTFPEEAKQALQMKEKALQNDISNSDRTLRPNEVSYLKFLLQETREKKSNLGKELNELKLEIKQVMNKSTKSAKTDLRYVYLTKEVGPQGDKDKDKIKLPEDSVVKIKDSQENIQNYEIVKELETLLETKEEEVKSLTLERDVQERNLKDKEERIQTLTRKLDLANRILTEASSSEYY